MDNKIILSSMAMDLKRAAICWWRNSDVTGERFYREAVKRKNEVDSSQLQNYMKKIISNLEDEFQTIDTPLKAEKALMYSTIIQNFVLSKLK